MYHIVGFFVCFCCFSKINRYVSILFIFETLFIYFIWELIHLSSSLFFSIQPTLLIHFYAFIYIYL